MNCEQVEELLSAYLDNMLTSEERRLVAFHLQSCSACSAILGDYSKYDTLITHLPRVAPDAALRKRLFSSPELFETLDEDPVSGEDSPAWTLPPIVRLPSKQARRDTPGRPQLIALPGGRNSQNTQPSMRSSQQTTQPRQRASTIGQRNARRLRLFIATLAAALIVTFGIGGFVGYTLLQHHSQTALTPGITPPLNLTNGTPLSAGSRYVFLRDNALWSELADGSEQQPDRLTPQGVSVAPNWVVSSPLAGRLAGDMLAYIDLQQGKVHVIRSDSLKDTTISQPLFKVGVLASSAWETTAGIAILDSLAWSPDGIHLAFLANPTGSGNLALYIYSTVTDTVTAVPTSVQGSISASSWSPDGSRVAFEVTQSGLTSIIDYNVENHGVLTIADRIGAAGIGMNAGDGVMALDWSPDTQSPAITWSVGISGHIHSLWMHRVHVDGNSSASLLLAGDYAQAIYSRSGDGGVGSWLVITSNAGLAGNIWRMDVTPGSRFVQLTAGRQADYAQWSPDGSFIDYLNALAADVGTLYIVNASTGVERLIANGVTNEAAPAWAPNSQQIAFSTGSRVGIISVQPNSGVHYLALKGASSDLIWSMTSTHQLIVAMNDGQQGIYLEDTQGSASKLLDAQGSDGPLLWTQIP